MSADFKIVWDFLERTGPEVTGHGYAGNIWPDAPLVERFIASDLSEKEKEELCDFLKTHPHYIQYLVGRLRHAGRLSPGERAEPTVRTSEPLGELSPPVF